jgi:hypothetical protein
MSTTITWDAEKRDRFRARYDEAVTNDEHEFTFEDHPFHTQYARHLLIYLDHVLKHRDKVTR